MDLKSGQLGDDIFRGPEVVHLYLCCLPFCLHWSPAPQFWHPARIQLPQLWNSVNSESLLPVPVDAHHQRGSVTLKSPGEFPASVQEQFHGGRAGNPRDKKHGLVRIWAHKAWVLLQSPDWVLCVNDFLTEIQAAPRESSPGEQPCERLCCHRRHVENWMEPWSRISLKLELAKKAVSCAQPRYYRAVGWKSQEITDCGIVLLV